MPSFTTSSILTHARLPLCLCAVSLALGLAGCEEEKSPVPNATAAPKPVVPSAAAAAPTPAPAPTPEVKHRPEKIDQALTPERRTAIESKYAEAKGFLVAKDLEDKLKTNKALKDKEAALAAFDRVAKGHWVLFAGNAVNLKPESFDMGIVYTPQLPNDSVGMSRQWFPVSFTEIDGYKKDQMENGGIVVVLAKYTGKGAAGPGHELVDGGVWQ